MVTSAQAERSVYGETPWGRTSGRDQSTDPATRLEARVPEGMRIRFPADSPAIVLRSAWGKGPLTVAPIEVCHVPGSGIWLTGRRVSEPGASLGAWSHGRMSDEDVATVVGALDACGGHVALESA